MKKINKTKMTQIKTNIKSIWKNCNDSTIFFLPLLAPKNKKFRTKTTPHIEFSFLQICFDYGLINTFLFLNEHQKTKEDNRFIYLLFDKDLANSSLRRTTMMNCSLHKVLQSSNHFSNWYYFKENRKYTLYKMQIPKEFAADYKKILKGSYSTVSSKYQNFVKITSNKIPSDSHHLGVYISTNNMPFSIASKTTFIKEEVEIVIDEVLSKDLEYYTKFRIEKEVFKKEEYLI